MVIMVTAVSYLLEALSERTPGKPTALFFIGSCYDKWLDTSLNSMCYSLDLECFPTGPCYIHTWKCHNEALCIDILNKQTKKAFSPLKNRGQEGKTDPAWELVPVGEGRR
jgi:hypothetical protein